MNNVVKTLGFMVVYPFFWIRYQTLKPTFPKVLDSVASLDILIKSGKSFARFGDGELNLISGRSIGFQRVDTPIVKELTRVLISENDKCYIGLPYSFSSLKYFKLDARCFWLYSIVRNYSCWKKYFRDKPYLDTQCSRFYMDIRNQSQSETILRKWLELWDRRNVVIIEGSNTKMGVGNDLFINASNIRRIICPHKNAFAVYEDILAEAKLLPKDSLILISLGPTASVLAYDLSVCGYQAIDTGHLDLEYNWMKSGAKIKTRVVGRAVNELHDETPEEIYDKTYMAQIIKRIHPCVQRDYRE